MSQQCLHCHSQLKENEVDFCCLGCENAYKIIAKMGLKSYYDVREINQDTLNLKPEDKVDVSDINEFLTQEDDNKYSISLLVQGLHCGACVWLIENILKKQPNVVISRINLSKKTLFLRWQGEASYGNYLIGLINKIGYKLFPYDVEILNNEEKKYNDTILKALAVAGFGAGNIMLFSLSLWFSDELKMGESTRNLLHLFSSLIAVPVIIYSVKPFVSSAVDSIKRRHPNMDLAISIAIFLTTVTSFLQTFVGASHVYFDSAVMLIFFLLIGRYLDMKARKKAYNIATEFSMLLTGFAKVEDKDSVKIIPIKKVVKDMILVVAVGDKIVADGVVVSGSSEIDSSIIDGETLPKHVQSDSKVFAGSVNISSPIKVLVTKNYNESLLSQIINLCEEIEASKNSYIRLSDNLSKFYLPAVHVLALVTFLFWLGSGWQNALTIATTVLIITCPCALALAVPIVQTIAMSRLIKNGILVKLGEAMEILPKIKLVVFDKTGTLTSGKPSLIDIVDINNLESLDPKEKEKSLAMANILAQNSSHPISQALVNAYKKTCNKNNDLAISSDVNVFEEKGFGLFASIEGIDLRLGRSDFCQIPTQNINTKFGGNFLKCFAKFGDKELLFLFSDEVKNDSKEVIDYFGSKKIETILLSGDRKEVVANVAGQLGIKEYYSEQTPISKVNFLEKIKSTNKPFIMVGDGVNDAPSLAIADVSISFSDASTISQNVADIVVRGNRLSPIVEVVEVSKRAINLMKQNLAIALIYNVIAIYFAFMGYVTPLVAAFSMSFSSLLVLLNSLKMGK